MPRTLDEGFRDFLVKLTPSSQESAAAKLHRASIKAALENNFVLKRFFRMGSFGNGTSIYGYSDVDYFASLSTADLHQNSDTSLRRVRDVLDARFPSTGVRVNCPAIKVPFGLLGRETTEVVIADFVEEIGGHKIYEVPDCSGGWMRSSPGTHNAYVRAADDRLNCKVKPLIRFLKAWKFYQNVPISSFYLEIAAAAHSTGESVIQYDHDIYLVLNRLLELNLQPIRDPLGIQADGIVGCKTELQRQDAYSKLQTAVTRAAKAVNARQKNDTFNAFEWWRVFYGTNFPSYYL
jgi:hypothetical protein